MNLRKVLSENPEQLIMTKERPAKRNGPNEVNMKETYEGNEFCTIDMLIAGSGS